MNFTITKHDDIVTISLSRAISHGDILVLQNRLWAMIDKNRATVILDLKDLPSLDTNLLSFIIQLKNNLNGNLALAHANDLIKNLLAITSLSEVIVLCESMETA